MIMLLTCEKES
jgi:hypothetical protein